MPSVATKSRVKEQNGVGNDVTASDARPSKAHSGEELAALLDTTSFDGVRQALIEISRATAIKRFDERPDANDARIKLANEFLGAGGGGHEAGDQRRAKGLLQAWDLADAQRNTVLLSLTLNCIANLINLLGAHQPNHERGEGLIHVVLSSDDAAQHAAAGRSAPGPGLAWHRLQTYLAESESNSGVKKGTTTAGGKQADPGTKSDDVTLAVLHVLLAISSFASAKFARPLFDSMTWSMRSLPRLMNMRKRVAQRKRDGKRVVVARGGPSAATLEKPDIRTAWILILLSFLRSPSGDCTSVTLRIAALSLGREFYPAIIKGLAQDPAQIAVHVLMGFHDGLLSDQAASKLPRSKVVGVFNEWTCKALVDLYGREGDMLRLVQSEEQHSIADVTHHFLLALCTHPGRGVCYVDDGWYGKMTATEFVDEEGHTDVTGDHRSVPTAIYNKILFGILRSLLPTRSAKQGELALRILAASPELTGPYLRTWLSVEPKAASISWLSASTFFSRALSIPLPSFRNKDGQWRAAPPSTHACLEALLPEPISKSMFARGLQVQDRLARFAAMLLLARVVERLLAFRSVCREASQDQRWEDDQYSAFHMFDVPSEGQAASADEVLTGQFGQRQIRISPWQRLWEEVIEVARDRLPDVGPLLSSIAKKTVLDDKQKDEDPSSRNDILLKEVTLRDCWLLQELLKDSMTISSADLDKLFTFSFQSADQEAVKDDDNMLSSLSRLHAIRAIASHTDSQHGGLELFIRPSGGHAGQSHLARLLRMQSGAETPMLRRTAQELVQTAMQSSLLFEHDVNEWEAWQYALSTQSTDLLDFLDECAQRCMKTPYRYVEIARRATLGEGEDASEVGLIASPLFFCMLEQYCIRLRKGLFGDNTARRSFLTFARLLLLAFVTLGRKPSQLVALLHECERAAGESQDPNQAELLAQLEKSRIALLGFQSQSDPGTAKAAHVSADVDLDELHPVLENVLLSRDAAIAIPVRIFAVHLAHEGKGKITKSPSWDRAKAIDAKMLFLAAINRLLEVSKDCTALTNTCLEALQRGAFNHMLLRRTIFEQGEFKTNDQDVRNGLVRIVSEGPFSSDDDEERQLVSPLTRRILGIAEECDAETAWVDVMRLLPFMEVSAVQEVAGRLLAQGRRLDCVCAMISTTAGLHVAEERICDVLKSRKDASEKREAAFLLRILCSPQVSRKIDQDQAQTIVTFIIQNVDSELADGALLMFLKRHSECAGLLLSICESSRDLARLLRRTPFALARASQLSDAEGDHSHLIHACAAQLFQRGEGDYAGAAVAMTLIALLQKSSDKGAASAALCERVPVQPGQAFDVHALLIAAELTTADSANFAAFAKAVTEKSLLWLVRRFAEDDEDTLQTVEGVQALNELLARDTTMLRPLAHLVEPVLTAAIRRRLSSPLHAELVRLLLTATPFASSKKQQFLSEILHNRAALAADADIRRAAVSATTTCIAQDATVSSADLVAALVPLYNGALSRDDRQMFQVFCTFEVQHDTPLLDALVRWHGGVDSVNAAAPDEEIIWRLDANRLLETCLRFPRARSFCDLKPSGYGVEDGEAQDEDKLAAVYDPLLVLAVLGQFLSRKGRRAPTGLQLIELLRTNALGVLACCLSSRYGDVRRMASTTFAKVYAYVQTAGFHEKEQLLVTLDALRAALNSGEGNTVENTVTPLPLTTTLFVAHALRAQAQPSLYLYPLVSRFLLQRAAPLDRTDVPLLYGFLFASSHQSSTYRQERTFILRFLAACLRFGGRAEWRIMKHRHVWHSIASLYTSAAASNAPGDVSLCHAIEEVWEAASHKQHIAQHVVVRLGFLQYAQQVFVLHPVKSSRDRSYWTRLLCRLLATLDLEHLHGVTAGAWLSSFEDLFDGILIASEDETRSDVALFTTHKNLMQTGKALVRCFTFLGEQPPSAVFSSEPRSIQALVRLTMALLRSVRHQLGASDGATTAEQRTNIEEELVRMAKAVAAALSPLCADDARGDLELTVDRLLTA